MTYCKPMIISVQETAQLLGMNPKQVREGIDNGSFPFGICVISASGKKIYKISKNRVYEFVGKKVK